MKWTTPHTGSLFFTLSAVMFLYCPPGVTLAGLVPVAAPKILSISENQLKLSCQVDPGFLKDETLVYWLVNNSFVETAFPSGAVHVSIDEGKKFIQSDLIFQSAEDIRDNCFTCVAKNPAGTDTKIIGKQTVQRTCDKEKRRQKIANKLQK